MSLIDTHCHIHSRDYPIDREETYKRALDVGVDKLICVGTDEDDSEVAIEFAQNHEHTWASIGLHPHDAVHGVAGVDKLRSLATQPKVVAVGECGLDYFYDHSPRNLQAEMLRAQIELALEHNLPLIFHVREAFDDFWPIFDSYKGVQGVLHSFTDNDKNLQEALERGLYIGVNGIATFTKVDEQKRMYSQVPLDRLLLETDAPFLTPTPKRGTVNEPAFVTLVAKYLADLHSTTLQKLSAATSQNANTLFQI